MTPPVAPAVPGWLERTNDAGLGCYVHLPFCDRICPYCDFAVVQYEERRIARYLAALQAEIDSSAPVSAPLQTLYFGGGTPSALSAGRIDAVVAAVRRRFQTPPDAFEVTLEANPARNIDDLARWRASGINRLSIGVQSLDDGELHRLGRTHTAAQAIAFYEAARAAGFANISMDFIAGVPGQRSQTFESSLQQALRCGVDHVSVYGLTIEAGTPYATWQRRDPSAFPDDDAVAGMLECAHDVLTQAGMLHYEISNFSRPGFESAHNSGYWRQRDCSAFGMSAAGYAGGVRYRNLRDFDAYCSAIESGNSPRADSESLSPSARLGEAAMLALRTDAGIDYDDFRRRFAVDARAVFATALNKCLAAGLLEGDVRGARLSRRGRLLCNSVCAEFLSP